MSYAKPNEPYIHTDYRKAILEFLRFIYKDEMITVNGKKMKLPITAVYPKTFDNLPCITYNQVNEVSSKNNLNDQFFPNPLNDPNDEIFNYTPEEWRVKKQSEEDVVPASDVLTLISKYTPEEWNAMMRVYKETGEKPWEKNEEWYEHNVEFPIVDYTFKIPDKVKDFVTSSILAKKTTEYTRGVSGNSSKLAIKLAKTTFNVTNSSEKDYEMNFKLYVTNPNYEGTSTFLKYIYMSIDGNKVTGVDGNNITLNNTNYTVIIPANSTKEFTLEVHSLDVINPTINNPTEIGVESLSIKYYDHNEMETYSLRFEDIPVVYINENNIEETPTEPEVPSVPSTPIEFPFKPYYPIIYAELEYQVDFWSNSLTDIVRLINKLDEYIVHAPARLTKTFTSADLYEKDTNIYHKVVRYKALVDNHGNIYTGWGGK